MGRIEDFKPQLVAGKMSIEGHRLVFENKLNGNQIILSLEMSEFLNYCDGTHSLAEIIGLIYKSRGYVEVKKIIATLKLVKNKNFLVNGEHLELPDSDSEETTFLEVEKGFNLVFLQRIFTKRKPLSFYLIAMALSCSGLLFTYNIKNIFSLSDSLWLPEDLFFIILISFSFLFSFKNFIKFCLQNLLVGRAYDLSIKFRTVGVHFHLSNEALFLANQPVYLLSYYFASALSPFLGAFILTTLFNTPDANSVFWLTATFVFLFDSNPFAKNELNKIFTQCFKKKEDLEQILIKDNSSFASEVLTDLESNGFTPVNQGSMTLLALWLVGSVFLSGYVAYYANKLFFGTYLSFSNFFPALTSLLVAYFFTKLLAVNIYNCCKLIFKLFSLIKKQSLISKTTSHLQEIENHDLSQLQRIISQHALFKCLPTELLSLILQKSRLHLAQPGCIVVASEHKDKKLYVLLSGQLLSFENNNTHQANPIMPISAFGELSSLDKYRSKTQIIAKEESILLEIPSEVLLQSVTQLQYVKEMEAFKNSILVSHFFNTAPYFKDLQPQQIQILLQRAVIENYIPKQIIFEQGDYGDSFYLVLKGQCSISINSRELGSINQNGFFGEISLIADIPRTSSVSADTACTLMKINKDTFWEVLAMDLKMAVVLEEISHFRIRQNIEEFMGAKSKIA